MRMLNCVADKWLTFKRACVQVGGERDHGFDRARYERLLADIKRYQRYLRHPVNVAAHAQEAQAAGLRTVVDSAQQQPA